LSYFVDTVLAEKSALVHTIIVGIKNCEEI